MKEIKIEPFPKHRQQLIQLNSALYLGIRALAAKPEDADALAVLAWVNGNKMVSHTSRDPNYVGMSRVPRPAGTEDKLAFVFVDDEEPIAHQNPDTRIRPRYVESANAILTPVEVLAHPILLAATTIHEGVHAHDKFNPRIEEAKAIFPKGSNLNEGAALLSEIRAYEYEGRLLEAMLGPEFRAYIQSEVDMADSQAIRDQEKNGGLLIEVGITPDEVRKYMKETISFTTEKAEQVMMGLLGTALPSYVMLKTWDQIIARNGEKLRISPEDVIQYKLQALPNGYLSGH